ncbi:hypothetical protein F2Q70_00002636 [Brassica cretica]|uniref:Uncharacterized protein n=1 Tax=Brassica cretica TaxID=69181 RepID=A0A8S9ILZ3_BRACR|nr:hypothetical protein F2Q70_00002636 [Brassica cretica]KAF3564981.1 hypothetical protein DY000_02014204 [Brassica cretica]
MVKRGGKGMQYKFSSKGKQEFEEIYEEDISFPCMTLRSVLANLMLVSGTCISEDEQGFPDPAEKEREVLVSGL